MEHLNKTTFKEKVINYELGVDSQFRGDLPCLVDFYADWCMPCQFVGPVLDELSKEYEGKINIYKVDTDEEEELTHAFGIKSIPALLFCPKEGEPHMTMGAPAKRSLSQAIDEILLQQEN
jgi:thioredoxin 1